MSFAKKTLTSAAWSFSTGYANIIIGFTGNLLLARILLPEDFGVFALASSLLVFVTMFTGFGSQEAIMQCRDDSIVDLIPTAFWISLGIGLIVAVGGVITGLAVWPHYGRTTGLMIILLSSLVPFTSWANARSSALRREMVFKPVALTQSISNIVSFILGIIAALLGLGPWALLVRQGSLTVFYWVGMEITGHSKIPRVYNKGAARWIWTFGWKKMFLEINNVIYGRYDNLMVGISMGDAQLGYYGQSYRLALLGQQFTQGALSPILYPMFAAVQFSTDKLRYGFDRIIFWTCRVIPLMGILILLSGKSIVTFLYGQKWAVAGQYFQMMFVLFIFLPIAGVLYSFLVGAGSINTSLKIGWIQVAFFVVGVTIGAIQKNIYIVIWAANLNYVLAVILEGLAARKIIHINWLYLFAGPALASAITVVFGRWLISVLPGTFSGTLLLVLFLTSVYSASLVIIEFRSIRREIVILLQASRRN